MEDSSRILLNSLVAALSTAIDERSPYNANHTRNMVKYVTKFMDWLDKNDSSIKFSDRIKEEIKMAIWLHDIGKLSVPLEIMDKSTRLGDRIKFIEIRVNEIRLLEELEYYKGNQTEESKNERVMYYLDTLSRIRVLNSKRVLNENDIESIKSMSRVRYKDIDGNIKNLLTVDEYNCLMIERGTLTREERELMENHVLSTGVILSKVKFPEEMKDVPMWAAMHHELLDGSGYPVGKLGKNIPIEVRLITIMDIFEALVAKDRPYKKPMEYNKAFEILEDMAEQGKVDSEIVKKFKESKVWDD